MTAPGRWALGAAGCGGTSVILLAAVAAAGDSAAVPGLGAATWHPPWDAGLHPRSGLVSLVLAIAYLLGAAAVALGLVAVRRGARPGPAAVGAAALACVALLVAVPPLGSADHLSYAAYGRIAAAGDNPYLIRPIDWRGGRDPVAGAIQPPWQDTPSVYGPVATAVQAATAVAGGGSLRLTVWAWQLVVGAAFLLTAWTLDRLARPDPVARARAAVLWTLNPLLLGQLVLGAHVDVLAAAAGLGVIALTRSGAGDRPGVVALRSLAGGALFGVAAGVKAPYALFGLAACWGLSRLGARTALRRAGLGLLGAAVVLVPAHLWTGPHTYDQLLRNSRFISFATPWRLVADRLDPVFGRPAVRDVVGPLSAVLAVVLVVLLARWLRGRRAAPSDPVTASATRAEVALTGAWVLAAPYALPWYDAMVWAPLALLAPSFLDIAMLARLGVLALAYVPGRVVELSPAVERITLGFRREVAPWLVLAALIAAASWLSGLARRRPPTVPGRPAPSRGR